MSTSGYDAVAAAYAANLGDDLNHKPFDTKLLDWFAERTATLGPILDLGCGPGQVAGYLHKQGVAVAGVDYSAEMVGQAQALHPTISFERGDMLDLRHVEDSTLGGVTAFYSIVNIAPSDHAVVFGELWRVLQVGGVLLLSFHVGQGSIHLDEMFEVPVSLDFYFLDALSVRDQLETAGFTVTEVIEREPYPEVIEHQSRRAYLFARKY